MFFVLKKSALSNTAKQGLHSNCLERKAVKRRVMSTELNEQERLMPQVEMLCPFKPTRHRVVPLLLILNMAIFQVFWQPQLMTNYYPSSRGFRDADQPAERDENSFDGNNHFGVAAMHVVFLLLGCGTILAMTARHYYMGTLSDALQSSQNLPEIMHENDTSMVEKLRKDIAAFTRRLAPALLDPTPVIESYLATTTPRTKILTMTAAALLMHGPGLWYQLAYVYTMGSICAALLGSLLEGLFLLVVLQVLFQTAQKTWQQLVALLEQQQSNQKNHQNLPLRTDLLLASVNMLWRILLILGLMLVILFCIAGDYSFQVMSGGEQADMWVLAAGFQQGGKAIITAQFQHDPMGAMERMMLPSVFVVAGIIVMTLPRCRYYESNKNAGYHQLSTIFSGEELEKRAQETSDSLSGTSPHINWILVCGGLAILSYALGCWCPVFHASLSFMGSFVFTSEGSLTSIENVMVLASATTTAATAAAAAAAAAKPPNVIYMVHESLSGAYALDRPEGRKATPFFHELMDHEDDFYVFNKARSVSGDTRDCLTTLATGCLPVTQEGKALAYGRSIATEFKRQGYSTASFSTAILNMENTQWSHLQNYLTSNFDYIEDPGRRGLKLVNSEGAEDASFIPLFRDWINKDKNGTQFYAQFYQFDSHFPFLVANDDCKLIDHKWENRLFCSMQSFDGNLKDIFNILKETGQLNNTIIVGSSDHGEFVQLSERPGRYARLGTLNSHILKPLSYMYLPSHLVHAKNRDILRQNTMRMISTLDFFPTLQNILYGGNQETTQENRTVAGAADTLSELERRHCVTGFDLLDTELPRDRVVVSWNTLSGKKDNRLSALSTDDDSALYINERADELHQLVFDNCTAHRSPKPCTKVLSKKDLFRWKNVIAGMQNSTFINEAIKNSDLLNFINNRIDRQAKIAVYTTL